MVAGERGSDFYNLTILLLGKKSATRHFNLNMPPTVRIRLARSSLFKTQSARRDPKPLLTIGPSRVFPATSSVG